MTGIIGREAVYSGKAIEWDAAMKSNHAARAGEVRVRPLPDPRGGHARTIQVRVVGAAGSAGTALGLPLGQTGRRTENRPAGFRRGAHNRGRRAIKYSWTTRPPMRCS